MQNLYLTRRCGAPSPNNHFYYFLPVSQPLSTWQRSAAPWGGLITRYRYLRSTPAEHLSPRPSHSNSRQPVPTTVNTCTLLRATATPRSVGSRASRVIGPPFQLRALRLHRLCNPPDSKSSAHYTSRSTRSHQLASHTHKFAE